MTRRILVVGDNRRVATLVAESLSKFSAAYHTEIAASGEEAWQRMSVEPFDLLIVDLFMPGMNGVALAQEMRMRYPDIRFVLMTNRGQVEVENMSQELNGYHCVRKPFSRGQLIAAVRAALAGPDAASEKACQQDDATLDSHGLFGAF